MFNFVEKTRIKYNILLEDDFLLFRIEIYLDIRLLNGYCKGSTKIVYFERNCHIFSFQKNIFIFILILGRN